jgi:hypothetical protein
MRSNNMRARISPKVMAMMIRNVVTPLAAMLASRWRARPDRGQFDKARRGVE